MRQLLYACAAAAAVAVWPQSSNEALSACAAILVEATPFVFASVLIARFACRVRVMAYLGCGCASGPSARSIPAAALTAIAFGPGVAVVRFAAAVAVGRLCERRFPLLHCDERPPRLLDEMRAIVPAASIAGITGVVLAHVDLAHAVLPAQIVAGMAAGFASAPCGIGAVAIAATLHSRAPAAAAAFLCVAGIADARTLVRPRPHRHEGHDAFGYALVALALTLLASRHGGTLVHPIFTPALAACAAAAATLAIVFRKRCSPYLRLGPALMLAGTLTTVTAPVYRATETTLTNLFAGEQLSFTGAVATDGRHSALVRYAITCCRADAAPIVVRLRGTLPFAPNSWLRVDGVVVNDAGDLRLAPQRARALAPPSDPFLYR